jgi:hypothetical protein
MKNKIYIETDGWEENEIDEIANILDSSGEITKRELKQFELVTAVAIIIGITFGVSFLKGFGDEMGRDVWKTLKTKFVERTKEKKNSTIGFKFQNNNSKVKFNVKTDDPELIDKAFTTIEDKLKEINEKEKDSSFFFDNEKREWVKIEKTNFSQKYSGIAASTGLIKQGEKSTHFTIEDLNEYAKKMIGTPLTIGHGGKQIGEITKAWVEDEKLMYEAGMYDGTSEEDRKKVEEIIKSGGAVSISFSDDVK